MTLAFKAKPAGWKALPAAGHTAFSLLFEGRGSCSFTPEHSGVEPSNGGEAGEGRGRRGPRKEELRVLGRGVAPTA